MRMYRFSWLAFNCIALPGLILYTWITTFAKEMIWAFKSASSEVRIDLAEARAHWRIVKAASTAKEANDNLRKRIEGNI